MSQADFSSEVAQFRFLNSFPANNYLFKDNNGNIWKRCDICSQLIIKTPQLHYRRSDVLIVNFEHISNLFLFLLLTFNQ